MFVSELLTQSGECLLGAGAGISIFTSTISHLPAFKSEKIRQNVQTDKPELQA